MKPFEATVEILKARLSGSDFDINQENAEQIAEFSQIVYNKLKELYKDQRISKRSEKHEKHHG